MDFFNYKNGELYCENVPVDAIARQVGTPAYVYSRQTILDNYRAYDAAFGAIPSSPKSSPDSSVNWISAGRET